MTKNLTNIKGLSEAKVMKIKEAASKLKATGFVSVKPLSNARDHRFSAHDHCFSALSSRSEDDQVGVGLYEESRKDQLHHHRLPLEGWIISIPVFDHSSAKQVRRMLIICWAEELRPEVLQRYFFLSIIST